MAIDANDADALGKLLGTTEGARAIELGFGASTAAGKAPRIASFVEYCRAQGKYDLIRVAAQATRSTRPLDHLCHVHQSFQASDLSISTGLSAIELAYQKVDRELLSIILEFGDSNGDLAKIDDTMSDTPHYEYLLGALTSPDKKLAASYAECCELLIQNIEKAPCLGMNSTEDALRNLFITGRYNFIGTSDLAMNLFRKYWDAGLFDTNTPIANIYGESDHALLPMVRAISLNNFTLVREFLGTDCNLQLARGNHGSLSEMARSIFTNSFDLTQTIAVLDAFEMNQRIRDVLIDPGLPMPNPVNRPESAPQKRRLSI